MPSPLSIDRPPSKRAMNDIAHRGLLALPMGKSPDLMSEKFTFLFAVHDREDTTQ
jgi:hypothetical protein